VFNERHSFQRTHGSQARLPCAALREVIMERRVISAEKFRAANRLLEGATAQEILRWAVQQFHPHLTMATAFGAAGCCLIHMLAGIEPGVRVFNLDTGYQFAETLELRERIKQRYGIATSCLHRGLRTCTSGNWWPGFGRSACPGRNVWWESSPQLRPALARPGGCRPPARPGNPLTISLIFRR
jgi:3'-phosphoadenosine 5'-phosphosulfate sulfotransferase (PAPS reductase)/FAD synthetase